LLRGREPGPQISAKASHRCRRVAPVKRWTRRGCTMAARMQGGAIATRSSSRGPIAELRA
jgi:hypothetical protein